MYIFAIYMKEILKKCTGFDWDDGNSNKNWISHQVSMSECEQIFFNEPQIISNDIRHSQKEKRYFLFGKTDSNRKLFVVFTVRSSFIRIISARDMNKKERRHYNEQ